MIKALIELNDGNRIHFEGTKEDLVYVINNLNTINTPFTTTPIEPTPSNPFTNPVWI